MDTAAQGNDAYVGAEFSPAIRPTPTTATAISTTVADMTADRADMLQLPGLSRFEDGLCAVKVRFG